MSRIVSVWLRSWPIARLSLQAAANGRSAPAEWVLTRPGSGGTRVVAASRAARLGGILPGELLASARAKLEGLTAVAAEPEADAEALRRLALWGLRYTPLVAAWGAEEGADGLFLDIAGCAPLFGGEAALLADLRRRLKGFGLAPRLAIADTQGAAFALARFGTDGTIVAPGETAAALAPLPLEALRLPAQPASSRKERRYAPPEDVAADLARLGLRRIGDLRAQPRAPFARRFGPALFTRLDQALGDSGEPLALLFPPPAYSARRDFATPVVAEAPIAAAAATLFAELAPLLARDGVGARRLALRLFRLDGCVETLAFGLAAPCRAPAHVARMVALRLERLAQALDAGLGFESASLSVLEVEPMPARQQELIGTSADSAAGDLAGLVDRLTERLGAGSVTQLAARASHIPERAVRRVRARTEATPWPEPRAPRPALLFPQPEAAEVTALVPEGPPRQFRWRGRLIQVAAAEGPERIAPEWWREAAPTRDYYRVEDTDGRRYWLYRAGGPGAAPSAWFLHGLFA